MHSDHHAYHHFTGPLRLARSLNSLAGIIEGIIIDQEINESEREFLAGWIADHVECRDQHPFNEVIPVVESALADNVLTDDEAQDILWLIGRMCSTDRLDKTTKDLQRLHAVLGGVIADGRISAAELKGLSDWMDEHLHLRGCWPYDEIGHLITKVLADGTVDEDEQVLLRQFFSEFVAMSDNRTVTAPTVAIEGSLVGLCAVAPEVVFDQRGFCFTGASYKATRAELGQSVTQRGGSVHANPTKKVDYLVIGAEGNLCWSYACYGRKVERAVELRKQGFRIMIIHERDFHDALVA